MGRVDDQRVAFGNRVGQRDIANVERPQRQAGAIFDNIEFDLVLDPCLDQLFMDQSRGKRCGIERHAEVGREIGHRADMIFVRVREDNADEIGEPFLDEFKVGKDQIDTRIPGVGKRHAEIDHQPLAVAAVEVDVHPDFARPTERQEQQFFSGLHVNS